MKLLTALFLLVATSLFGAVPSYTVFRGSGGISVTTNPPTGLIVIDGSGIFTSSGTNATIAVSSNGVLVMVAATNINFITGSNVFLAATNIGSTAHIGFNAFTPVPFIQGAVSNYLLTYILPVLTVDTLTVSNLLSAPPWSSVQFNSNGITRGSAGFIYTNGQVRVADVVIAGQGVEVTAGSFVLNGGDTALVSWNGLGRMRWPTGGVVRFEDEFGGFNRWQLGGDTAAAPAIGRTNGDVIILGANGKFKAGDSTNKLRAPAVFVANDSGMGTPLLRLENPLNAIGWDLAINSNPETFLLGLGPFDENYVMVLERTSGNVGIGITNPTTRLDVQGRFMSRSNVYFPNIPSNALPVAFLATDSNGEVYETAVPTGGGGTAAGDSGAIQFNQDDAFAGTNTLVFDRTNNRVGIGIVSPLYTLDVQASTGIQRLVSTTAANGSQLLFVNNSEGLIGLESSVAGTTVAGSSEYSLLVANQYAYPVQLATDNTVRMTVLPTSGNIGIVTGSPTNALDVSGHTSLRSNLFLANLPTNGSPIAFLATDAAGAVYETAVPAGGGGSTTVTNAALTNLIGTVARNVTNVVSLSTTNATSKPLTNAYANGTLTLFGVEAGANVTITPNGSNLVIAATAGSSSSDTNAVLTNFINTVGRNITNFVSLSTSNATSKPLTNSYTAGVVTVFGIEAGANITLTPNASNIVIAGASSSFAAGNSNQIPFINQAQTGYTYAGYLSQTNPGFGFSPSGPHGGYGGLMVFGNSPMGLVTIGHPNAGGDFETFSTALVVSNRYASAGDYKNDMVKIDAVMIGGGLQADSTMTRWRVWQGTTSSNDVAELTIGGRMSLYGGTLYSSNTLAFVAPTAAELGVGGYWVGRSNASLVTIYSLNGSSTAMKVLAP